MNNEVKGKTTAEIAAEKDFKFLKSETTSIQSAEHIKCNQLKEDAINYCPRTNFLIHAIKSLGCKIDNPDKFISCIKIDGDKGGGFQTNQGGEDAHIYLAENAGFQAEQVSQTLSHELIHAYDQCRAHIKWTDLLHHACTEIRASTLSGECDFKPEFNRGKIVNFKIAGKQQECVKRRAELSVAMNPHCKSQEKAKEVVAEAFHNCYNDIAPFDRMP